MENLEERIKKARGFAGLTQPKLAKLLGVSHRTVTTYEKDASKLTVNMSQKIASVCGVDDVWLLTGQGKMEVSDPSDQDIVKEHQALVKKFRNPDQGLRINQRIILLQEVNPKLLEQLEDYLSITCKTAQTMMGNQDWDELERNLKQKPGQKEEEEIQRKDTGSE